MRGVLVTDELAVLAAAMAPSGTMTPRVSHACTTVRTPGGEVAERALQGQRDGESGGADDGDTGGGLDSDPLERRDHHDRQQQRMDQVTDELDPRLLGVAAAQDPAEHARGQARPEAPGDEDGDREDDVGPERDHVVLEHLDQTIGGEQLGVHSADRNHLMVSQAPKLSQWRPSRSSSASASAGPQVPET